LISSGSGQDEFELVPDGDSPNLFSRWTGSERSYQDYKQFTWNRSWGLLPVTFLFNSASTQRTLQSRAVRHAFTYFQGLCWNH